MWYSKWTRSFMWTRNRSDGTGSHNRSDASVVESWAEHLSASSGSESSECALTRRVFKHSTTGLLARFLLVQVSVSVSKVSEKVALIEKKQKRNWGRWRCSWASRGKRRQRHRHSGRAKKGSKATVTRIIDHILPEEKKIVRRLKHNNIIRTFYLQHFLYYGCYPVLSCCPLREKNPLLPTTAQHCTFTCAQCSTLIRNELTLIFSTHICVSTHRRLLCNNNITEQQQ